MPFYILKGDLVSMKVDAIVNAANVNLKMVEGVGRAIFHNAGDKEMTKACKDIGRCAPGDAVVTPSFNIENTKMIIHAVAPIYLNGKHNEYPLLRKAYLKSLEIAKENGCKSIAFPLLGGEFNWPLSECFQLAQKTILEFLTKNGNDMEVSIVMYKNFPGSITDELHEKLTSFVTTHFKVDSVLETGTDVNDSATNHIINMLYRKSGLTEAELSILSNISVKTIHRILDDETFKLSKIQLISIGVALKLEMDELQSLLKSGGYRLNQASLYDLVVTYFIENKQFDIYLINNALFHYDFYPLGENY